MMWGYDAICALAGVYETCKACPALVNTRSQVVFGGGSVRADIVVVGEMPGATEDKKGEVFVGDSGKLLMNIVHLAWPENEEVLALSDIPEDDEGDDSEFFKALRKYLDQHVFWTNVGLCWPGEGNRPPSDKEVKACKERLERTIYAVDPMLVLAMGKTAISALLGKKVSILDKRGTIFDVGITSPATGRKVRYPVMAVLHPSYLLRKGDAGRVNEGEGDTHDTIEDLRFGISLLDQEYKSLWDEIFPYKPEEYK